MVAAKRRQSWIQVRTAGGDNFEQKSPDDIFSETSLLMINYCPQCQHRLSDFAVVCDECGWSLVSADVPGAGDPQAAPGNGSGPGKAEKLSQPLAQTLQDLEQAMRLMDASKYDKAIELLNRSIEHAPIEKLGESYSLRGYCHLKMGHYQECEDDCSEAIKLNWSDAQTFAWRAATRGEQNRWRQAFDDLDRAISAAGDEQDEFLALLDSYRDAANEWFDECQRKGDKSADLEFQRGWVDYRCGKYESAGGRFRRCQEIEPRHPWGCMGLARLVSEGRAKLSQESPQVPGDLLTLCNHAIAGPPECQRLTLPIRAQRLRNAGKLDEALSDLNRLADLSASDAALMVECSRLRMEAGDVMVAIEELTEVLDGLPAHAEARLLRGDCYQLISNYPLAEEDYTTFLEYHRDHAGAYVRRAEVALAMGETAQAELDLEQAVTLDEKIAGAWHGKAKLKLGRDEFAAALADCEKAIGLDNTRPELYATLAAIQFRLGRFTDAVEEYSRAIGLAHSKTQTAEFLYRRGTALYERDDFRGAKRDLRRSCRLRPGHAGAWIWQAAACSRLERWSASIICLQRAIRSRPVSQLQYRKLGAPIAKKAIAHFDREQQRGRDDAKLFRQRGIVEQFLGKFEEAIRDFSESLDRQPDHVDALRRRGQCHHSLSATSPDAIHDAIGDFVTAVRADESDHEALYELARCYADKDDVKSASKAIHSAIKLAPRQSRYHVFEGELYQKIGSSDRCIQAWERALLLDPTDSETFSRQAKVYYSAGRYLEAIRECTRALELEPTRHEMIVLRGQASQGLGRYAAASADFELVLSRDAQCIKAWTGRAASLGSMNQHERGLIWLTKGFHRFAKPAELSQLIFARGKLFYQMGRLGPAIDDFTTVTRLARGSKKTVAAARYARGIAKFNLDLDEKATQDFQAVAELDPDDLAARLALTWLTNPDSIPRPPFLEPPERIIRPTRPPVVRKPVELTVADVQYESDKPHDTWILHTVLDREYGPLPWPMLELWIREGRIDFGMKLLRSDWSKWKRVERLFPQLDSGHHADDESLEVFPRLASVADQEAAEAEAAKTDMRA